VLDNVPLVNNHPTNVLNVLKTESKLQVVHVDHIGMITKKNVKNVTTDVLNVLTTKIPMLPLDLTVDLVPLTESTYQNVFVQLVSGIQKKKIVDHVQLNVNHAKMIRNVTDAKMDISYTKINVLKNAQKDITEIRKTTLARNVIRPVKLALPEKPTLVLLVESTDSYITEDVSKNAQICSTQKIPADVVNLVPTHVKNVSDLITDNVRLVLKDSSS